MPDAMHRFAPRGNRLSTPSKAPSRIVLAAHDAEGLMLAYEELDAWKRCHVLALAVYQATSGRLDKEPDLLGRMRVTAVRAAARIAFGSGSGRTRTLCVAAGQAAGYLSEFGYHLSLVRVMGVLADGVCARLEHLRARAAEHTEQLMAPPEPPTGV